MGRASPSPSGSQLWTRAALAVLAGILLAAPYLRPSLYVLAWVSFVPLLVALRGASVRESYLLGSLTGLVLYGSATYWIVSFLQRLHEFGLAASIAIALVFWTYNAQATALVAALLVWARQRLRVPEVLLFAPIVVGVYAAFPTFAAFHLGETQVPFAYAIQGVDFTGVYGLDFMIALANFGVFVWLTYTPRGRVLGPAIFVSLLMAMWCGYGAYALRHWAGRIEQWPVVQIGIVQPNESPSVTIPEAYAGFSRAYAPEMKVTEDLVAAGADVVIWPETRFKAFFRWPHVRDSFARHVDALGKPLLFHDLESVRRGTEAAQYNTAVFLRGPISQMQTYRKRQRMAFGEYIPLVSDVPVVRNWVRRHFGEFFAPIAKGERNEVFSTSELSFVPLICYEIMLPTFVSRSFQGAPEGKILVALTNDGWFGRTRQPYQHAYASVLRAVENRVPLVHAINNGPSIVATPDGAIRFLGDPHLAAGYVVALPYSREVGGSFYSRHPYAFIGTVWMFLLVIVCGGLIRGKYRRPRWYSVQGSASFK